MALTFISNRLFLVWLPNKARLIQPILSVPYLVCHSSTLITSESGWDFRKIRGKESSNMKNSQFSENIAAGKRSEREASKLIPLMEAKVKEKLFICFVGSGMIHQ